MILKTTLQSAHLYDTAVKDTVVTVPFLSLLIEVLALDTVLDLVTGGLPVHRVPLTILARVKSLAKKYKLLNEKQSKLLRTAHRKRWLKITWNIFLHNYTHIHLCREIYRDCT